MARVPHVRVEGVSKTFGSGKQALTALDDVTLDVAYGEFLSILGPSGCGKSTLLRIIGGLMETTAGSVTIGGKHPKEAQAEKAVGYVFQDPALLPWRTVKDNIRLPIQVNRARGGNGHIPPEELLRLVGLERFPHYYPYQLSGGMQQRVALARTLAFNPTLLLMDEPLGSLDEITRAAMRYELLRIWEATKKTVVFVTHSIAEAVILSDRIAVLSARPGRVVGVVEVDLPRPRAEGLERSEEILRYSKLLHALLIQGGSHAAPAGR
ncbi:MAG: ABC transporter ATP-binding protein [Chloroflexi bacterium]|nr:ABC transporter ATP-binding protein [Chloroflexota bacterium]